MLTFAGTPRSELSYQLQPIGSGFGGGMAPERSLSVSTSVSRAGEPPGGAVFGGRGGTMGRSASDALDLDSMVAAETGGSALRGSSCDYGRLILS